jgi:Fe-Mn family superoxide dismutase
MKHQLPPLSYDYAALEPHIDVRTMQIHHDKHHAAYVEKLNAALDKHPDLQDRSPAWLLLNLSEVPEGVRTAVRNNAGGHLNHSMYWRAMSPKAGGGAPKGPLADAINRDFGSFEKFKAKFDAAGEKLFGSGWVWLVRDANTGKLEVTTTQGHDNPIMEGQFPLLLNDVWEHAYYLKHQNKRPDFLEGWWLVASWQEAARRFEHAETSGELEWEEEAGTPPLRSHNPDDRETQRPSAA